MRRRRVILVGQAPSRTSDPSSPMGAGVIARRLAAACRLSVAAYAMAFDRRNLIPRWHGKSGKGDAFDASTARRNAAVMTATFDAGDRVIMLGRAVAVAFGYRRARYLSWHLCETGVWFAVFPHPSGINTWWNDKTNRRRAGRFMTRLVARHG